MKKLFSVLCIICFLGIAILAACAPSAAPAPAKPSAPAPTPAPTAPAPAPAPVPAPVVTPKAGGILKYPSTIYPTGFDPHRKPSYLPFTSLAVFNTLVRYDPTKAETSPATIQPDLAERWSFTPDGLSWTFNLRKDVKWHDGKPFTADDVVYNFEKFKDPQRSTVNLYYANVLKAERTDDYTVKLTLKEPAPDLLVQLTSPYVAMTAKHKADVDWRSPTYLMGTGPFKLKEAISGSSIELVKNPDYFRTGKPYLDGFTQYIIAAPSAQMDAVTTKRADMTNPMGFGIASKDDADRFLTTAKGTTTEMRYSTTGNLIWFNTKYKPISDARVRKAFSLIADRAIMATASWGDVSFATLKHGFFPPYWGLPPDEVNKLTNWNNTEAERVAEAKKLMADAGYSDGFKLTMLTVSMPSFERQFVWLADQLKKNLKIEAEIRTMELAELLKVRGTGDFQVLCYASLAILGEPNEFMPLFTTGNPSNYGGYSNPQLDALWKQQANEMDLNKRKQLVQQIERILLTDMPAMPTGFNHYLVGWWPYVKGFVVQGGSYTSNLTFENVWLDK